MEEKSKSGFDFKKFESDAIEQLRLGKKLEGKDGILAPLIKQLVEASLNGEMNAHLNGAKRVNRRNGKAGKQVKTSFSHRFGTIILTMSIFLFQAKHQTLTC